jgi:hypothetical protein
LKQFNLKYSWLLSTTWGKHVDAFIGKSDSYESSCKSYKCFNWGPKKSAAGPLRFKRQVDEDEPEREPGELNFVILQNFLKGIRLPGPANDEAGENGLTAIPMRVGSWAKFSAAVLILSIPVTVFMVALLLTALVTDGPSPEKPEDPAPNDSAEDAGERRRSHKHKASLNEPKLKKAVDMLQKVECSDSRFCKFINVQQNK